MLKYYIEINNNKYNPYYVKKRNQNIVREK